MRSIILFFVLLITSTSFAQQKSVHHHKHKHTVRARVVLQWIPTLPERCFRTDILGYVAQLPEFNRKPTTQTVDICVYTPRVSYYERSDAYVCRKLFKAEEIKHLPYTNINEIASLTAGVYQTQRGASLHADGGRNDGNVYIIDGMYALQR